MTAVSFKNIVALFEREYPDDEPQGDVELQIGGGDLSDFDPECESSGSEFSCEDEEEEDRRFRGR